MKETSVLSSPDSPGSSRPGNGASSGPQNNAITLALSCPDTTSSNTEGGDGGDGGDGNIHVGRGGHGLSNSSSNSSQTPVQIVPNEVKQTGTASEAGATGTEMESQLTRPASSSRSSPPVQAVAAASPAKDADTAAAAAAAPVRRSQRASMPQLSGRNGADVGGNVTSCAGAAAGGGVGTGSLRGSPSVLRPHSVSLAAAASAAVLDGAREQDEQPR